METRHALVTKLSFGLSLAGAVGGESVSEKADEEDPREEGNLPLPCRLGPWVFGRSLLCWPGLVGEVSGEPCLVGEPALN